MIPLAELNSTERQFHPPRKTHRQRAGGELGVVVVKPHLAILLANPELPRPTGEIEFLFLLHFRQRVGRREDFDDDFRRFGIRVGNAVPAQKLGAGPRYVRHFHPISGLDAAFGNRFAIRQEAVEQLGDESLVP